MPFTCTFGTHCLQRIGTRHTPPRAKWAIYFFRCAKIYRRFPLMLRVFYALPPNDLVASSCSMTGSQLLVLLDVPLFCNLLNLFFQAIKISNRIACALWTIGFTRSPGGDFRLPTELACWAHPPGINARSITKIFRPKTTIFLVTPGCGNFGMLFR